MKKNVMMRAASALLVAVLLTTCAISGTFAKYVTSASSTDTARVAYWGFQTTNSLDLTGLFSSAYTNVNAQNNKDVIAPGTTGNADFAFAYDNSTTANGAAMTANGPEVAYTFTVDVVGNCDEKIKSNYNIQWKLDEGEWGTFDELVAAIKALSGENDGSKDYAPNTLPQEFGGADDVHTISWQWLYKTADGITPHTYDHDNNADTPELNQDEYDTYMGNMEEMDDVSITINITATQID